MTVLEFLKSDIIRLDGGMGTLLQQQGLAPGERPEYWNLSHPEIITDIHKAYFEAGSNIVCTNTFGANSLHFSDAELEEIVKAAVQNAKNAKASACATHPKWIALDIGPSGKLLKPFGDLDFEDAVDLFGKTVKLGVKYGVDLILIETMNDCYETKAALLAAKENTDLPVFVSNAYNADGKLMTGAPPAAMVAMLEGLGADAIGANCSLGPKQLRGVVTELCKAASVPVILKPNAGLPRSIDGKTIFDVSADEFASEVADMIQQGVRIVGGCCGTTPQYIRVLTEKTLNITPPPLAKKHRTVVSSYAHTVEFCDKPILIGERINPTGKKRFKQAIIENDIDYILSEGINQQEKGVDILDVNAGLPDIDEVSMLKNTVCELQAILNLPLQIDTSDISAMEAALRSYNGKAMINSVNGKKESMEAIFPLVKKYGGVVVALTLDEDGIPETADGRIKIAQKILQTAATYGIEKQDLIFDPLAMTISADNKAANATLTALQRIRQELGCHTLLGVSNVSFGLPCRDAINSTFFAMALQNGLSAAIMNPYSDDMMKTYFSYCALKGLDENCAAYMEAAKTFATPSVMAQKIQEVKIETTDHTPLQDVIIKGIKDTAAQITHNLLETLSPITIIDQEIIPALNTVGVGFEAGTVYLPQLLMSAEAAKAAFEVIKSSAPQEAQGDSKGIFVIATVQGDIHDIGKNIVRLLLENYGFRVIDLGKDVPPEVITQKVMEYHAPMVGLSALMTTTVPAMKETIQQLKENAPWCKVIVGGAVLNPEYAQKIGADHYAKDAMEAVRVAEKIIIQ